MKKIQFHESVDKAIVVVVEVLEPTVSRDGNIQYKHIHQVNQLRLENLSVFVAGSGRAATAASDHRR